MGYFKITKGIWDTGTPFQGFIVAPIAYGFFVLGPCYVVWFVLVLSSLAIVLLRERERERE